MIWHFPFPYEDELFYSLVARFRLRMPYPDQKRIGLRLFGVRDLTASVEFPSHLSGLFERLPPGHPANSETILEHHTFLRWYAPFMAADKAALLRDGMLGPGGPSNYLLTGFAAHRLPSPHFLKFCPDCFANDLGKKRELYWRRVHQLAGVEVCPGHRVFLENSAHPRRDRVYSRSHHAPSAELIQTVRRHVDMGCKEHRVLMQIAQQAKELISSSWPTLGLDEVRSRHLSELGKLGLLAPSGRIRLAAVHESFEEKFGAEFLKRLGCGLDRDHRASWIGRLLHRSERAQAPLRQLLMLCHNGVSVKDFFNAPSRTTASESRLAACPNPLCVEFGKLTAFQLEKKYSRRSRCHLEVHECKTCGCRFALSNANNTKKSVRIIHRGAVWQSKLRALWLDTTKSIRHMANQLKVNRLTVKREAFKCGLRFPRCGIAITTLSGVATRTAANRRKRILQFRLCWESMVRASPGQGVTAIRKKNPAIYSALHRLDREWLSQHAPEPSRHSKRAQCDWSGRDVKACRNLLILLKVIEENPWLPVRLTKMRLARAVGAESWLKCPPDRMKLFRLALNKVSESWTQTACRRVRLVTAIFKLRGVQISRFQFKRLAGINRKLFHLPQVAKALEDGFTELGTAGSLRISNPTASRLFRQHFVNLEA